MISKYVVIETQVYKDGTAGTLVDTFASRDAAEQKYHTILAAAAVSNVSQHSATMLNGCGNLLKNEYYIHGEEEITEEA